MKAVSSNKARAYRPTSAAANAAGMAFVSSVEQWAEKFSAAKTELASFVRENVKAKALGFVASDALSMSAFGIVFETNPGAGFIAVPNHVAEKLRDSGLGGQAYFPDIGSELGKKMMAKLNAVSRTAEQRPLLKGVPGVSPVALEGDRVVLSRAVKNGQGVAVLAAPSALAPAAEVVAFQVETPARTQDQALTASKPKARMS